MQISRHNAQCPTCLKSERQAASATHPLRFVRRPVLYCLHASSSIQYHDLANIFFIHILKSLKVIQAQCNCQFFMVKNESSHLEFNNALKELNEVASTVRG